MPEEPSVLIKTLGCKLNQLESEAAAEAFLNAGFVLHKADGLPAPSVILINTCTVTSKADQKARRIIRKMLHDFPESLVAVTGCYAELEKSNLENLEKIDDTSQERRLLVLKKDEILKLPQNYLKKNNKLITKSLCSFASSVVNNLNYSYSFQFSPKKFSSHTRSFLKIQDGCDNHCTYCRIRLARGKSISLSSDEVLKRLRLLEETHSEAVITGVNICQYRDASCADLGELLEFLLKGTKKISLRLSSLSPLSVNEKLADVIANERIKPHFHLSLQSANEEVLKNMGRHYNHKTIEKAVALLRSVKDDPFLACDIITGFPGETKDQFEETFNFCRNMDFSWIHVFPYSKRPGTSAASFPCNIEEKEITRRVKLFSDLAVQGRKSYVNRWLGREIGVLVEKSKGGLCTGVTDNYLKVIIQYEGKTPSTGSVLQCRLLKNTINSKYDALAVIIPII